MNNKTIVLNEVQKTYYFNQQNIKILDCLNFNSHKNQSISIMGPSGSGKTTLLMILAGIERITSGSVHILGQDLEKLNDHERIAFRGKNIGLVFQNFHLIEHINAIENIALPRLILGYQDAYQKAEELLEVVKLSHRKNHLPFELSGGECQRVAIARSLINKPQIILADEPTGNLDNHTSEVISDYLFNTTKNYECTMIIVTHNEKISRRCDHRYLLNSGRLDHAL